MQLVLSNNRVIAHGENFLALGGVVINTSTGAKYENATIAECECVPCDIDTTGYEYHAGEFVPCAPFGMGNNNGYFMEVCEDCATPRSSGIPIKDIKWNKLGSVVCSVSETTATVSKDFSIPVSTDELFEYSMLRYRIKGGSYFNLGRVTCAVGALKLYELVFAGGSYIFTVNGPKSGMSYDFDTSERYVIENDIVVPKYLFNSSYWHMYSHGDLDKINAWLGGEGMSSVNPLTVRLTLPGGYTDTSYQNHYTSANVIIDIEGRK